MDRARLRAIYAMDLDPASSKPENLGEEDVANP
jgi:hypothetical protein